MAGRSKARRFIEHDSEAVALFDISQSIKGALDLFGVSTSGTRELCSSQRHYGIKQLQGDLVREMIAIHTSQTVERIAATTSDTMTELASNTQAISEIAIAAEGIQVEIASNTATVGEVALVSTAFIYLQPFYSVDFLDQPSNSETRCNFNPLIMSSA